MALDTIYQLRLLSQMGDQSIENVFFYNGGVGTPLATDLAISFESDILPAIQQVQSEAISYQGIIAINLGDLSDFVTLPVVGNGTLLGADPLPSFSALGFSYKLDTRAVRPGSKRIAGVPEVFTDGNTVIDAAYLADVELLRLALLGNVVSGSATYSPVVLKRVRTAVSGTVPLQYTYRLPTTDGELVMANVVQVLFNPKVTSQVSRKA